MTRFGDAFVGVAAARGSSYVDWGCLTARIANDTACIGRASRHYEYVNALSTYSNPKMPFGIDDIWKSKKQKIQ